MTIPAPTSPLAAPVHPDPYPYYAALVATRPFHYDDSVGMWVAASAAAVEAALASPDLRVRPQHEPIPPSIAGTAAGTLFGRLARMSDGSDHARRRRIVDGAMATFDDDRVATVATACARRLLDDRDTPIAALPFRLPAYAVATLSGVRESDLARVASWVDAIVRAFAPTATPDDAAAGADAAERLSALVATRDRHAADDDVANAIGLLTQSYEATAGLIGNTVRALAAHRPVAPLDRVLREVARHDAPVQNTRRFVERDTVVAGQRLRAGDVVLVLLAAANRDPAANADPDRFDPDRFDPDRAAPRCFTFGAGAHRCPGTRLAFAIAAAGVSALRDARPELSEGVGPARYRASLNGRIAML